MRCRVVEDRHRCGGEVCSWMRKDHPAWGYCPKHYKRWYRYGSPFATKYTRPRKDLTPQENFLRRVSKTERCWLWTGPTNKKGYGDAGNSKLAHRLAWELFRGPIPPGLSVLHECDTPACVNPFECLWLGTAKDNSEDMVAKGRSSNGREGLTKCKFGHDLTPGKRQQVCRICKNLKAKERRLRTGRDRRAEYQSRKARLGR